MPIRGAGVKKLGVWWFFFAVAVIALVMAATGHIRGSGQVICVDLVAAALTRMVLGPRAGGLVVRGMKFDVAVYLFFAASLLYATATINLTPR